MSSTTNQGFQRLFTQRDLFGNMNSLEWLVIQGRRDGKRACGRAPTGWKILIVHTINKCLREVTCRAKWKFIVVKKSQIQPIPDYDLYAKRI